MQNWRPSDDEVGNEYLLALDMVTHPRYPEQRGRAVGWLLSRWVTEPVCDVAGYERDVREDLPPLLAAALCDEAIGKDVRREPGHDESILGAAADMPQTVFCRPLADYLTAIAQRPAGTLAWRARYILSTKLHHPWLTPELVPEVVAYIEATPREMVSLWIGNLILNHRNMLGNPKDLIGVWSDLPDGDVAALMGAGLYRWLDADQREREVRLACGAGEASRFALEAIVKDTGDVDVLTKMFDLAADPNTDRRRGTQTMYLALLLLDNLVFQEVSARCERKTLQVLARANEIAKLPRFERNLRVRAILARLS